MKKILLLFFILGIFFYFFYNYTSIVEGLKCDPNKPKVYPKRNGKRYGSSGYNPSDRECQIFSEKQSSSNLKNFDYELKKIKSKLNESRKNLELQFQKHDENVKNTKKVIASLNCKRDDPNPGDINCNEENDDDSNMNEEGEGEEVDIETERRISQNNASRAEKPSFNF